MSTSYIQLYHPCLGKVSINDSLSTGQYIVGILVLALFRQKSHYFLMFLMVFLIAIPSGQRKQILGKI